MSEQDSSSEARRAALREAPRPARMPLVATLVNGLEILEGLAAAEEEGRAYVSASEQAEMLGLHKSTVLRLLSTLEHKGYVERDPETKGYRLRWKLFQLGSAVLTRNDLVREARPILEELARATGEVVHLSVLDDDEVVYVDKVEPPSTIRMYSRVGRRSPAHCTGVGKALIAFLPDAELNRLLEERGLRRYTRGTITDPEVLRRELARVRQTGVAYDEEEHEEGICCVAAPVRDHRGAVVASISVAGPAFRLGRERRQELAKVVRGASERISARLGYAGAAHGQRDERRRRESDAAHRA